MFLVNIIYFLLGFSAFDAVTSTFYIKDFVALSTEALISLGIWTSLPWSIKLIFGSIIDTFPFRRKTYLYLSLVLMLTGEFLNLYFVSYHPSDEFTWLLVAGLVSTLGTVLMTVIAGTLCIELAGPNLAKLQFWSRTAQFSGALAAAAITGYLAANLEPFTVYSLRLLIPVILALIVPFTTFIEKIKVPDWKAFIAALAFGVICVTTHSQIVIAIVELIVIIYFFSKLTRSMPGRGYFISMCVGLFLLRAGPSIGPSLNWWMATELHFNEEFLGMLRLVGAGAAVGSALVLRSKLSNPRSLTWLTLISLVMWFAPFLALYFPGLMDPHHYFLVDNAFAVAVSDLTMIPLGIIIATYAPREATATYIAVTASFMNLALMTGDLLSKGLNSHILVTRTDFSQFPKLLILTFVINVVMSLLGIYFVQRRR